MENNWTELTLTSDSIEAMYYNKEESCVMVRSKGGITWRYNNVDPNFIQSYEGELTTRAILEALRHNNIVGVRVI
jgi:hypothetical protein